MVIHPGNTAPSSLRRLTNSLTHLLAYVFSDVRVSYSVAYEDNSDHKSVVTDMKITNEMLKSMRLALKSQNTDITDGADDATQAAASAKSDDAVMESGESLIVSKKKFKPGTRNSFIQNFHKFQEKEILLGPNSRSIQNAIMAHGAKTKFLSKLTSRANDRSVMTGNIKSHKYDGSGVGSHSGMYDTTSDRGNGKNDTEYTEDNVLDDGGDTKHSKDAVNGNNMDKNLGSVKNDNEYTDGNGLDDGGDTNHSKDAVNGNNMDKNLGSVKNDTEYAEGSMLDESESNILDESESTKNIADSGNNTGENQ